MEKIKLVHYGIGVMGRRTIEQILSKSWIELVGAIDISENLIGKDLGDVLSVKNEMGINISNDPTKILSETKPDIVLHTTQSYVEQVFDQLVEIIKNKVNIISTCEELSNPFVSSPNLAEKLDDLAKKNNVTVLGTGINPGFLMDYLPIVLTGPCQEVEKIEVYRLMNASKRRIPFQKKIGAGLTPAEFNNSITNKLITGHVGLEQSLALIADSLKWKLDAIRISSPKPVISKDGVSSDAIVVKPGNVCGIMQDAKGILKGKEVLLLDFKAFLGSEEEYDSIKINGIPDIAQRITPCINGDIGTVSMVINSIPRVIDAPPGLITMKDLPPPIVTP
jgi:4-hydroxy-tetrahydrodipicolinate reductase